MDPLIDGPLGQVAILLLMASIFGLLSFFLRQPMIVAFIAVGIVAGPPVLGLVSVTNEINFLANTGIMMLLFTVGLKLDINVVWSLGYRAVVVGLGQIFFTTLIGMGLCKGLGMETMPAIYVSFALTFSSTAIIVKILSDKHEIDSLHGRMALSILITQDLVAILVLIVLTYLNLHSEDFSITQMAVGIILKVIGLVALTYVLAKYALPRLFAKISRSRELLVLLSIALATIFSAVTHALGLSKEVGALMAGIAIASTPYPYQEMIGQRLLSLRDFMLLFFFIVMGANVEIQGFQGMIWPSIVLSLFVLIGNPLIVFILMVLLGHRPRTALLTGITVGQISEFSFLLGTFGRQLNHIDSHVLGLITIVGLSTITLSTYMINYSHQIFRFFSPWLDKLRRVTKNYEDRFDNEKVQAPSDEDYDVILLGLGRYGSNIAHRLRNQGSKILGVDFDPKAVERWQGLGLPGMYGDADDPEIWARLPLEKAKWVVCSIPNHKSTLALLSSLEKRNFQGRVAAAVYDPKDLQEAQNFGPDVVLVPFRDAANMAARLITTKKIRGSEINQ